ncbi:SDR family NAD(P)-dependent oxidoreductase [Actinomycetospora callitridis]|uniref:SDR family NAD(P)-dependent oxidoreductase n=1 Tax=Actinomycetospora callitridis TaxID=913944 RepID=UPI0023655F01|nr:SDR family NAD(P)-dependent oxidoreductase [Actinomycetospora callitridis]MDD7918016.1 SDR family NAD(P)-dependent oxidoreductase [Actinomycetospora callitridis]
MADRIAESPAPVVLVLGGRSEIGVALACRLAASGRAGTVVLAARRADDLAAETAAVRSAGAEVATVEFDADDLGAQAAVLDAVEAEHGLPDTVVLAFGVLGDQARAERDAAHAAAVVHTDYTAQVAVLTEVAARMRARGRGEIVVFSSVAGVRVRRANYVYGSAKAGLDGFASGLADALHGSGVHLTLVRPGFVIGRMTADSGIDPAPLSSTPGQVADATADALTTGRDVVWVPGSLRVLFTALRLLPRWAWRRLPR